MYTIGFDAKRLFHNGTGLGNYSRSLVRSLYEEFPSYQYLLFTPSISYTNESFYFTEKFKVVTPKLFSKVGWRSRFMLYSLLEQNVDLYHGLSHELPFKIETTDIKTVVTIHDVIYKFFPNDFPMIDKAVYDIKWKHACAVTHAIIATSEATKRDIIHFFGVPEEKIHVVYQSCDPIFETIVSEKEKQHVCNTWNLPTDFILYVGAITERKNVLQLVQAYNRVKNQVAIPLVIVGNGRQYLYKVKQYIEKESLQSQVKILTGVQNHDLPALYQSAQMFIYPSKYEGFGIPILESLKSGTPVIASNTSSLPEVGGNAAMYIHPDSIESLCDAMVKVYTDKDLRIDMIEKGFKHASNFSNTQFAYDTMSVYKKIV
ncbi:MAG TPA: glycosyltransferase family 1 protein [Bacteroidales bacterium]|jgi:glycosyltransferase involved in cell wall biosynthesis|nr:glycosyltransferase family 1 protein [Bacteroidales bacterium]HRS18334.1 glycosyltransferase family 1 protein [Bacteroidales bacterium]